MFQRTIHSQVQSFFEVVDSEISGFSGSWFHMTWLTSAVPTLVKAALRNTTFFQPFQSVNDIMYPNSEVDR